ncbi:MAG: T9SS type A sorting domain-containing protein [Flavobacteriales bacterium]|nr:T9SS type A sorting domain-containing protein [Flavobacteriales bacterium]
MKKNIYFLFFLFITSQAVGQNLVVNPSFEQTTSNCGNFGGEGFFTDLTGSWDNASNNVGGDSCSSPDLFSACNLIFGNPAPTNMPNSVLGYQYARTGTRHAGIITHEALDEYREYIQGRTTTPLVAGQSYCVSMYVSLGNAVLYATNNMGIYFGSVPYQRDPCPGQNNSGIYVTPQLNYDCAAITDTSNWVRLEWNYVASGGEQYFLIGNFFTNANTTIVNNPGGTFINPYAYYYIDDVSIVATNECCYADLSSVDPLCVEDDPITLEAVGGVGSSCSNVTTGSWSGNGITNATAGTFDPAVAGAGTHTLTYTLSCGYSSSVDVTVLACAALTVCQESNGDYTVTGGTGPYTWSELGEEEDCSACQDLFPIPPCTFPPGCAVMVPAWIEFGTTATVTPTGNWPIQVVDSEGGTLEIASAAEVPLCTEVPCELGLNLVSAVGPCSGGATGSIIVGAQGNVGAVTYSWDSNPPQTGETALGLSAGTYTVTATDQQGCEATLTQTISAGTVTADAGDDQTICKGEEVTLSATGGVSYEWSNGSGTAPGQSITFSPTVTTTYTVTATGSNGCTGTDDVTVFVYEEPVVNLISPSYQLCDNAAPIELEEDPTGGTFDGPGMSGSTFNPSAAGVGVHTIVYTYYEVPECPGTDQVTITVDLCTGITDIEAANAIMVLPNPFTGQIVVRNDGPLSGKAQISVTDVTGRVVHEVSSVELGNMNLHIDLSHLADGQYLLNVIKDQNRISTIKLSKQ